MILIELAWQDNLNPHLAGLFAIYHLRVPSVLCGIGVDCPCVLGYH